MKEQTYIVKHVDQRKDEIRKDDRKKAHNVGHAAILDVAESFAYMHEHDGDALDELACRCVMSGDADVDERYVIDPDGIEWLVTVYNLPVSINLREECGKRVTWVHNVGAIQVAI